MKFTTYKARDVMREPIVVSADTRISEAIERIINEGIGSLLVVNAGKPVGIVTKRDLLWALVYGKKDPEKDTVDKIMSENLVTVEPDTDLAIVINKMITNNISHIPVVENDKVVGIISDRDLVELLGDLIEIVEASKTETVSE